MAIEAIKGAGMVYQGSTSTAQIKEQAQGRTEVSSADNQVVSDSIARNIQAMNTKEASGDSAGDAGAQGQAQAAAQKQNEKNMQLKKAVDDINKSALADQSEAVFGIHEKTQCSHMNMISTSSYIHILIGGILIRYRLEGKK